MVSNGYRNLLVGCVHPGVHVFEPSTTVIFSTAPPSASPVLVRRASSPLRASTTFVQSTVQRVRAKGIIVLIVGLCDGI